MYRRLRNRPLAGNDQRGPEGRGLHKNHPRFVSTGLEKPPWSTVEGADLETQQLYAQSETLQLQDGIFYRNFLGTDGQVRWKPLLVPRSVRAPLLQHLHEGPTAVHMGVKKAQDRVMKMAY